MGIKEIRELIVTLAKRDKITILVSSHLLSEIEQMATKIGIINKGLLLEEITLDSLMKKREQYIRIKVSDSEAAIKCLTENLNIKEFTVENGVLNINRLLVTNNIDVEEICLIEDRL